MNDPVLFLDIDGVLNRLTGGRWPMAMDARNVALLDAVVAETGCLVVISSTWRTLHELPTLVAMLVAAGFTHPEAVIGITPELSHLEEGPLWRPVERGEEIAQWRRDNAHGGPFCVWDDTPDMTAVWDHFIHVSSATGVTEEDVRRTIRMLDRRTQPAIL
jgi:hypothetical protein